MTYSKEDDRAFSHTADRRLNPGMDPGFRNGRHLHAPNAMDQFIEAG